MSFSIVPIVEGHGDVSAIPTLLNLIVPAARVLRAVRLPRGKFAKEGELERMVAIAQSGFDAADRGLILVVLDADEDCAANLGPNLFERLKPVSAPHRCYVAIAVHEFESWICGGHPDIDRTDPEAAGRPKDQIRAINGGRYSESVDQKKFTARIDVKRLLNRSPSFKRLHDSLRTMVNEVGGQSG